MNERLKIKVANLKKAFASFLEFSKEDLQNNMPKAAFVKAFEFTFELSWKTIKAHAEENGLSAHSPKDSLRAGLQLGAIANESLWLQMLSDRNLSAHTYSVDYLPEMLTRMRSQYVPEISRLIDYLESN